MSRAISDLESVRKSLLHNRSKIAWDDWQDNLVLTSIKTTGLPLGKVDYPAIVICGQGNNDYVVQGAFTSQMKAHLLEKGNTNLSKTFNYLTAKPDEQIEFIAKYMNDYLRETFVGMDVDTMNPTAMLQLMTTTNPRSLITAEVAYEGGYDPCEGVTTGTAKRRKRESPEPDCPEGFKYDSDLAFCYTEAPEGEDHEWCYEADAEPFKFYGEYELQMFINISNGGA